MAVQYLQSTNLAWMDRKGTTLILGFARGHVYEYYDVPKWVDEELLSAPSQGQYFKQNLYYGYKRNFLGQWRSTAKGVTYDEVSGGYDE